MMKKNVMIFPSSFGNFSTEPENILKSAGIDYCKYFKAGMTEDEVIEKLQGYSAVILGLEPMTEKVMRACPDLKIVARYGVGMDNVDKAAAAKLGIQTYNTPGANAEAVADYTFGLMLDLARSISNANRDLKDKQWNKYKGYPVYGATLGIIGMGAVGKAVIRRAKGFNMQVLAYDIYWDEAFAAEYGVVKASLEDIYRNCDFISLHTALTPETKNMISMEQMKMMKDSAFIINCARGGLVNEEDLMAALNEGVIAGAGIDAFCEEPPFASPLLSCDKIVAAPHIAGSSIDAINTMALMSAKCCVKGFEELEK